MDKEIIIKSTPEIMNKEISINQHFTVIELGNLRIIQNYVAKCFRRIDYLTLQTQVNSYIYF